MFLEAFPHDHLFSLPFGSKIGKILPYNPFSLIQLEEKKEKEKKNYSYSIMVLILLILLVYI
jgi:hypothetical protein